jgi:ribA/ribD-fused uncharacterized protein
MKYNLNWLIDKIDSGGNIKYIFFWSHRNNEKEITKSCLSQWYEVKFLYEKIEYKSAEHWMMAQKARLFKSNDIFDKIIKCITPGEAKKLGREIPDFDNAVWDNKKYDIVLKGNLLKFSQNEKLCEYLINTKERIIAEASPVDNIWGIGLSHDDININNPYCWNGENLLGFALMEVRDILKIRENYGTD